MLNKPHAPKEDNDKAAESLFGCPPSDDAFYLDREGKPHPLSTDLWQLNRDLKLAHPILCRFQHPELYEHARNVMPLPDPPYVPPPKTVLNQKELLEQELKEKTAELTKLKLSEAWWVGWWNAALLFFFLDVGYHAFKVWCKIP